MSTTDDQEAEPQDLSRFQAFVRTAARAASKRPGRTWLAAIAGEIPAADHPRTLVVDLRA